MFLVDSHVKISSIVHMVKYSLLFLVLLVTTTYAQIGPDGTGTVNGYTIGPGADLYGADLRFANLTNADLYGADLYGAILYGADLSGAVLTGADLRNAALYGADLRFANLTNADLSGADLTGADLSGADLSGADLNGIKSGNITGTPTLPSGYQMVNGYIVGPNAALSGADLRFANLSEAILLGADLRFAILQAADLTGADLTGADLSEAILRFAVLTGADLSGAILGGATWTDGTVFGGADYTITQAEYETALSDLAAAIAERDARPTQVAYDTVVAERDAKLTLDEVKDLRAGSTMIAVENGTATLSMEVVQSDDLEIWTSGGTTDLQIPVDANSDTKFFRFKMTE